MKKNFYRKRRRISLESALSYFIGKYEIDGFLEKENPLKSGHEK